MAAEVLAEIKEFIKMKGPSSPLAISKAVGTDSIMASAFLSDLIDKKEMKISSLKVGSSPLYYLPGQEASLQNFSMNIHEKGRQAYELLKEKKVLRDKELTPVIRAALRDIKDFAFPLDVTFENNKELFWRWYLLDNEGAEKEIKNLLEIKAPEPRKEEVKRVEQEVKKEEVIVKKEQEIKLVIPQAKETIQEIKKETMKEKKPKKDFLSMVKKYFENNKIKVINEKMIKKNSEFDFIIGIPSNVGELTYYCKAKSKPKVNESDLASAFANGQVNKLPILFLSQGDLNKKAQESLNEFKGLTVKKV